MPLAKENEVKDILADFEPRIHAVVECALAQSIESPRWRSFLFPRTQANVVFDFICQEALREFGSDKDIRVLIKEGTIQFLFKDQVLLRFKKGNTNGVGSNIETQSVLQFIDPQRNIPGLLPDIHYVEACYQMDDLRIKLSNLEIVARDRMRKIWSYPIQSGKPEAEIIPLVPRSVDPTSPSVTPKQKSEDAEVEE